MSEGFTPVDAELTLSLEGQAVGTIANNLTTTVEGYALDARQGYALDQKKLDVAKVANNLNTTEEGWALDARRGKYLDEVKVGYTDIADDLTTEDAQKVLSAKQGKTLKDEIASVNTSAQAAAQTAQQTADGKVSAKTASVSLGASSWSGSGPYTQTKTVSGVTASNIVLVAPAYARQAQYYACGIGASAQAANSLTFSATTMPTVAIGVNVLILD